MKKACVLGFNRYESQPSLRGCVDDARDFHDLIRHQFNYESKLVVDEPVTTDRFVEIVRDLLAVAPGESGGSRVLYYAGHGYRTYDKPPFDEGDGIDELLCLPGYRYNDPQSYVLDDLIGEVLDEAAAADPTMRVYVLFDSCHSGTAIRGSVTWKSIEPEILAMFEVSDPRELVLPIEDPRMALVAVGREAIESQFAIAQQSALALQDRPKDGGLSAVARDNGAPHLLLSGCSPNETSKETVVNGDYRGVFTSTASSILRAHSNLTWRELHAALAAKIPSHYNQHPQLDGFEGLYDTSIFA